MISINLAVKVVISSKTLIHIQYGKRKHISNIQANIHFTYIQYMSSPEHNFNKKLV